MRASSRKAGLILPVFSSTSKNTGIKLFWYIGLTVVGKPAATVIISLPSSIFFLPNLSEVSADSAKRFADEPEFVRSELRTPR